uniref:RRM domain-containing protein n=1 Tax=Fagus sylvatica TaxID=28930 RepID=A0A2N9HDP6_FAGSY
MMPFSSSFVSQEEFNTFHTIDRKLYTFLVINLWRDPVESMQVMALWLWLEHMGFDNIVLTMLSLPYTLINELADEAIICLNCIHTNQISSSSENNDIPLIQSLMEKEISLQFFLENRLKGIVGIAKIVNEVCIRALSDIMQQAIDRNAAQSLTESQMIMQPSIHQSLVHPGLCSVGLGGGGLVQPRALGIEVPTDDRTMFVTFSKGYPVQEWEVRDFFTRSFGDCIESLHMQEVQQPHQQSLFARIIFHKASTMEMILNGMGKVKFTINGKHVWGRKFVPKRAKSSLLPPLPPSHMPGTSSRP